MKIHDIISENKTNEGLRDMAIKTAAKAIKNSKLVNKLGSGLKNAYTSFGAKSAAPVTALMKWSGRILTVLKFYGLYQMAVDYREAMGRGEAELKAGRWTQEQFDLYHQNQMATLVSQIALSTTFFLALKVFSGWSLLVMGLKWSRQPIFQALGMTLSTLAKGTQLALIGYLSDKEVRNTIADVAANGIIDNTLGAAGVAAVEKFNELIGKAEKKAKGQDDTDSSNNQPSNDTSTSTGSSKPATGADVANDKFKGID